MQENSTFEESLFKLEEIIRELEKGGIPSWVQQLI